jgi:predicted NodU family carbamoyl transferase
MIVLGLNAWHGDSAAALVKDGKLIAAAEEERFRRIKHWSGLPTEAMKWCLADAGLTLGDVDHIAINRNPKVNNLRRALYVLRKRPSLGLIFKRLANIKRAGSFEDSVRAAFPVKTSGAGASRRASPRTSRLRLPRFGLRSGRVSFGRWLWRLRQLCLGHGEGE